MRAGWLCPLAALLLIASVSPAGDKSAPAVVVRVRSLDAVLQNAKLLVNLTGEEAAAQQIQGLLKAKVGAKGIEGVDPTRPLGAYIRFGKEIEDVSGAILIPIADEKAFVDLLERLGLAATKGKNGVYTVQTGKAFDLYFRFVNKYAYVTAINPDNLLDKNLLDPARVLTGKDDSILSALIRLEQLPEGAKLLAQVQLEQELQNVQEKGPKDESPGSKAFRLALLREFSKIGAGILKEGAEMRLEVGVDAVAKDFAFRFALTGQPGSALAQSFQDLGKGQSPFAGLIKKEDIAFLGAVNATLPEALNKAFAKVIDEAMEKAQAELRDEEKKKQAEQLYQALAPSLRGGQFDGFLALLGPTAKHYTLLAAVRLREGDKLGKTVHDLIAQAVKTLPAQEQAKIQLDADSVGAIKIHKFELPAKSAADKQFQQLLGSQDLYVAFRADAVFFALGKTALPALKEALAKREEAAVPVFLFNFDVARMVPFLAKTPAQRELAEKIFQPGQESNLRIVVNGGAALSFRLQMKLDALGFLAKMSKQTE
jgi:hypothetical protein